MKGFLTPRNLATAGGILLSIVLPRLLFQEDYEYEYVEVDDLDDLEELTEPYELPAEEETVVEETIIQDEAEPSEKENENA